MIIKKIVIKSLLFLSTPLLAMELSVPVTAKVVVATERTSRTAQALAAARHGSEALTAYRILANPRDSRFNEAIRAATGYGLCKITDSLIFSKTQESLSACQTEADGQRFFTSFETYLNTPDLPKASIERSIQNIDRCLVSIENNTAINQAQKKVQVSTLMDCRDAAHNKITAMNEALRTEITAYKKELASQSVTQISETYKQLAQENKMLSMHRQVFNLQYTRAEQCLLETQRDHTQLAILKAWREQRYEDIKERCIPEIDKHTDLLEKSSAKLFAAQEQLINSYAQELKAQPLELVMQSLETSFTQETLLSQQLATATAVYEQTRDKSDVIRNFWEAKKSTSCFENQEKDVITFHAQRLLERQKIGVAAYIVEQKTMNAQVSTIEQTTSLAEKYRLDSTVPTQAQHLVSLNEATLDMIKTMPENITGTLEHGQAEVAAKRVIECVKQFGLGAVEEGVIETGKTLKNVTVATGSALAHPAQTWQQFEDTLKAMDAQEKEFTKQFTGDFSKVNELLAAEPVSIKEYYTRIAEHYRTENLGVVSLTDQDVEKFVYREILKDRANKEFWKEIAQMSPEQIARVAGREAAQFIIGEGALRGIKATAQIIHVQRELAKHGFKTAMQHLTTTVTEKASQAANRIAQALPKTGESIEIATAGTESVFKTTIKNPGVAEACEKITANPPKMEMVKKAGKAGAHTAENATTSTATNAELVGSGSTLRKVEYIDGLRHAKSNHLFGNNIEFSLKNIDPAGNPDKWAAYINKLAQTGTGTSKKIETGEVLEIMGTMPKTGGGELKIGVRLCENARPQATELQNTLSCITLSS